MFFIFLTVFFVITVCYFYNLKKINNFYFKITLCREPRIIPGSPQLWNQKSCRVTSVDREYLWWSLSWELAWRQWDSSRPPLGRVGWQLSLDCWPVGLPPRKDTCGAGSHGPVSYCWCNVTLSVILHPLVMISFDISVTSYLHSWLCNPRKNKFLGSEPLDFVLF